MSNEENDKPITEESSKSAKLVRLQIAAVIAAGLVDNPALSDEGVIERALKLGDKLISSCLKD